MFPEEIIELLQKYQSNNINQLKSINNYTDEIINQLKLIRGNLSRQMSELINNDSVNDKEQELLNDTQTLRNYINSISKIKLNNRADIETSEEISFKEFKDVRLYLCTDNVCPICGCNMNQTKTSYGHVSLQNHLISNKKLDSYMCPACHRYFVAKDVIDTIKVDETNIKLLEDFYDEIPSIDIYSAIVLSNTLNCSVNHNTKDLLAKIPVLNQDGKISYLKVNASYCFSCKRFTILKSDFLAIKDIVMCKIIDETTDCTNNTDGDFEMEQKQSILFQYGYNVQTKKNLSEQQRHIILSSIIEAQIMNRRDVINHINTLIDRGSKIPSWYNATQKWKEDKKFVSEYRSDDLPEVIFSNIVLKHKRPKQS